MRFARFVFAAALFPCVALAQTETPAKIADDQAAAQKAAADKARAAQQAAKKAAAEKLKARQTRPDNDALAARLVASAGIRERDIVLVRGNASQRELVEDIALAVRQRGGSPVLQVASDRYTRRLHEDLPKETESEIDPLEAHLAATATAIIAIDSEDNPTLLNHIATPRLVARAKADNSLDQLMFRRGVRRFSVGRGLYPAPATANRYTLSTDELERAFWYACSAEPRPLKDVSDAVYSQLSSGNQVAITGPNGTDLKFRIENRPVYVNDGVITADEARAGGARALAWLPAGEAYCGIIPGTAEGKVVCDSLAYRGREVQGLTVTFKAGRVVGLSSRSGGEAMKRTFEASFPLNSPDATLSSLDIGLNPDIAIPRGVKPMCSPPAGMVTLGIGSNLWAGGDNDASFQASLYLPGCTVTVDKIPLVKDGALAPNPAIPFPLVAP